MKDTVDTADLTVSQKILLAAHTLEADGHRPMTIEALTVAAWKDNKRTFGLRGYDDLYPNSNVLYAAMMGERGLAKRGWLVKVGPKLYTLSAQGKAEAERILAGDDSPTPKRRAMGRIEPTRECEAELERLLITKAVLRLRANQGDTLNRTDAFAFWGDSDPDGVDATVAAGRECLVGGVVRLRNGREVGEQELSELGRANAWLKGKFSRDLGRRKVMA